MDNLTGRTIGPYELRDRIGTGGMATVYRGVHRALGQDRAVKILLPAHTADPTLVERFRSEAKLAASLQHPNIVSIYDVGEDDGLLYFVMDLVEGMPLGRLLDRQQPLPLGRAVNLLRQLGSALDYAHARGVIHRDVKSGNVLIGPNDHLTLFDFGIARGANVGRLTKPGLMVGTPYYLAPEVISGAEGDRRADLYALGILAYEMVTGRLPFHGADTMAVLYAQVNTPAPPLVGSAPGLTQAVERAVHRQLSKKPDDRYLTAHNFVSALSAAGRLARPVPTPPTATRASTSQTPLPPAAPAAQPIAAPSVPSPAPTAGPTDASGVDSATVRPSPLLPAPAMAPLRTTTPDAVPASPAAASTSAPASSPAPPSGPATTRLPPSRPSRPHPDESLLTSLTPGTDSRDTAPTPPTIQRPGHLMPPTARPTAAAPDALKTPPPQTQTPAAPPERSADRAPQSVARVLARSPRADGATEAAPTAVAPDRRRSRDRMAAFVLVGLAALIVVAGSLLAVRRFAPSIGAAPTTTPGAVAKASTPATASTTATKPVTGGAAAVAPAVAAATAAQGAPGPTATAQRAAGVPVASTTQPTSVAAPPGVAAKPGGPGASLVAPPATPPAAAAQPTTQPAPAGAQAPGQQLAAAQAAVDRGDFPSALAQLGALNQTAPGTEGLADGFYRAHLGYGQQLLEQGQLDQSNAEFGEALTIHPGDPDAQAGQNQVTLARLWQTMEAAWGQNDADASAALEEILSRDPHYRDANVKLYSLLVTQADRLQAAGDREGALAALRRAEEVYPEGGEAQARLATLTPPTPTPVPRQPQPQTGGPAPAAKPAQAAPAQSSQPPVNNPTQFQPPQIQPPAGVPAIPAIPGR
jgi:serine/threonine-protein kinase